MLWASALIEPDTSLLSPNSRYRKPVNEALLKLKENGTYEQLYRRWFTSEGFQ
jgi:ABC-type amino acid transport substrate-binding protein